MTDEKPLHVQVAEALGWTGLEPCGSILAPWASGWRGWEPGFPALVDVPGQGRKKVPRYDDARGDGWSAAGPLIESYAITLEKDYTAARCWKAEAHGESLRGETPLIAICHLILALKDAGKLVA